MSTEVRIHSCEGCDIKKENKCLRETVEEYEKRLRHLLRSKTIQLFDEWDPQNMDYKRDIRRLDTYGVYYKVLEYDQQKQRPNPNYTPPASVAIQEPKVELAPFRPCEVDGKPAVFHRWVDEDRVLLHSDSLDTWQHHRARLHEFKKDGLIYPDCHTEAVRHTFALVEYTDGSVGKVEPEKVKFTDRRATE